MENGRAASIDSDRAKDRAAVAVLEKKVDTFFVGASGAVDIPSSLLALETRLTEMQSAAVSPASFASLQVDRDPRIAARVARTTIAAPKEIANQALRRSFNSFTGIHGTRTLIARGGEMMPSSRRTARAPAEYTQHRAHA